MKFTLLAVAAAAASVAAANPTQLSSKCHTNEDGRQVHCEKKQLSDLSELMFNVEARHMYVGGFWVAVCIRMSCVGTACFKKPPLVPFPLCGLWPYAKPLLQLTTARTEMYRKLSVRHVAFCFPPHRLYPLPAGAEISALKATD